MPRCLTGVWAVGDNGPVAATHRFDAGTLGRMDRFPAILHGPTGGINCPGLIRVEAPEYQALATLRCDECGVAVGEINRWILRDLVNLTTDLDQWQPTADGINPLPAPLRNYIHDLETRADPAGEVQELALARMTITALEARIRELEST